MGRGTLEIQVTMSVSRHNSPEDDADNARWNKLRAEIVEAAERHGAWVMRADGPEPEDQWVEASEPIRHCCGDHQCGGCPEPYLGH